MPLYYRHKKEISFYFVLSGIIIAVSLIGVVVAKLLGF
jgi:hypothetical protein